MHAHAPRAFARSAPGHALGRHARSNTDKGLREFREHREHQWIEPLLVRRAYPSRQQSDPKRVAEAAGAEQCVGSLLRACHHLKQHRPRYADGEGDTQVYFALVLGDRPHLGGSLRGGCCL